MTTRAEAITLQVSVAPSDLPFAGETLRHQLRQWGSQVDAVVYTLDLRRSAGPRGRHFDEFSSGIVELLSELTRTGCQVEEIDYSDKAVQDIGARFFGGKIPPSKDCFGAPFYGYFFGLASVTTRYVLHLDADILLGGGSPTWTREALDVLRARPEALFICPLAGPPTSDGRIPRAVRRVQRRSQAVGSSPVLEHAEVRTYRLRHVSSRIFFTDLERLAAAGPFEVLNAPPWTFGSDLSTTPYLPAETVLSHAMQRGEWVRLDYLGTPPGMWFLHPSQRGPVFNANVCRLTAELERGATYAGQAGRFELSDEWLDAVGPLRYMRPRQPGTTRVRRIVGSLAGIRAARVAYWKTRARFRGR